MMLLKVLSCMALAMAWLPGTALAAVDDGYHCFAGVCKNGSTCKLNDVGKVYCANCPAKYTGNRCQTLKPTSNVDDGYHCFPGVCKNGSTCKLNSVGKVYCTPCPAGYEGNRCQTPKPVNNVDDGYHCFAGVCKNGSTCKLNDVGKVYCTPCPAGYEGNRCQTPKPVNNVDDGRHCFAGVCKNGSTCKLNASGWVYCTPCPAGYEGNRCQTAKVTNACTVNPCQNGASCNATSGGGYTCNCEEAGPLEGSYGGKNCQIAPEDCGTTQVSCGGNSGPSGYGADYYCCASTEDCINSCGATACSRQCITKNRPKTCDPNPCLNGGECFYFQAGPKCQCTQNWTGLFCEKPVV